MERFKELYERCVENAMCVLQIDCATYLHSKTERAVDARVMVAMWLTEWGLSEWDVCRLTGWKQQRVNYLKNLGRERMKRRVFLLEWEEFRGRMG